MRFMLLTSLVVLTLGPSCRGQQRLPDEQRPAAETKSVNMTPAAIKVPYTNVQTCHDGLQKSVPSLWEAFDKQLVPAANKSAEWLARLDEVLQLRERAWESYLTEGGNPRVAESYWTCCVADLAEALVDAEMAAVSNSTAPPDAKRASLTKLKEVVGQKLSWSPRLTAMKLSIDVALGEVH
jgi:hypothetical protein